MRAGYVAAAAVIALSAGCSSGRTTSYGASSDTTTTTTTTTGYGGASAPPLPPVALSASDFDFVAQAGFSGLAEAQLGALAQTRSANPAVQNFARLMVADHSRANAELSTIAQRYNVVTPLAPDAGREQVATLLSALSGAPFDRQYLVIQIAEDRMAVALFRTEASLGQNPELRAYAARYEPILSHHLALAEQLAPQPVSMR